MCYSCSHLLHMDSLVCFARWAFRYWESRACFSNIWCLEDRIARANNSWLARTVELSNSPTWSREENLGMIRGGVRNGKSTWSRKCHSIHSC